MLRCIWNTQEGCAEVSRQLILRYVSLTPDSTGTTVQLACFSGSALPQTLLPVVGCCLGQPRKTLAKQEWLSYLAHFLCILMTSLVWIHESSRPLPECRFKQYTVGFLCFSFTLLFPLMWHQGEIIPRHSQEVLSSGSWCTNSWKIHHQQLQGVKT